MKILIVHAHPEARSFSSAMKNLAAETLAAAGHEVRVSDLYAMEFNPVASAADFKLRSRPDYLVYALEQRNSYQAGTLATDISVEVEKLKWADFLLLNFPIFWFSVPAIMKGWIDRVLVSGLTYGGKRFYDKGGLKGKKAMIAITLGGRPHMFGPDAVHGELDVMLRHLLRGTLYYTGLAVLPPFVAYHVPYVPASERGQVLEAYLQRLSEIESVKPLVFPSLDEFDEKLYRKRI